jgi:hypothetical protein
MMAASQNRIRVITFEPPEFNVAPIETNLPARRLATCYKQIA